MKREQLWLIIGILVIVFFAFFYRSTPWTISNTPQYQVYNMMSGGMMLGMTLFWILVILFLVLGSLWFGQQLFSKKRK